MRRSISGQPVRKNSARQRRRSGEELAEDVFRHWDASKTELPEFKEAAG